MCYYTKLRYVVSNYATSLYVMLYDVIVRDVLLCHRVLH